MRLARSVSVRTTYLQGYQHPFYIAYLSKDALVPFFGLAIYGTNYCLVAHELPMQAKKFVEAHEMYHLTDKHYDTSGVAAREFRATLWAARQEPRGFLQCTILSITNISRIHLYLDRLLHKF